MFTGYKSNLEDGIDPIVDDVLVDVELAEIGSQIVASLDKVKVLRQPEVKNERIYMKLSTLFQELEGSLADWGSDWPRRTPAADQSYSSRRRPSLDSTLLISRSPYLSIQPGAVHRGCRGRLPRQCRTPRVPVSRMPPCVWSASCHRAAFRPTSPSTAHLASRTHHTRSELISLSGKDEGRTISWIVWFLLM